MDYYSPSSNLADSLSSQSQLTDRFSYTPSKMSLPSPATAMHRSDTSTSHQAGPSSTGGPKQNAFNSNADNSSDSASLPQYHSYDDFDDFEEFEHDMSFHSFDDGDRNAPLNSAHSCSYQQPASGNHMLSSLRQPTQPPLMAKATPNPTPSLPFRSGSFSAVPQRTASNSLGGGNDDKFTALSEDSWDFQDENFEEDESSDSTSGGQISSFQPVTKKRFPSYLDEIFSLSPQSPPAKIPLSKTARQQHTPPEKTALQPPCALTNKTDDSMPCQASRDVFTFKQPSKPFRAVPSKPIPTTSVQSMPGQHPTATGGALYTSTATSREEQNKLSSVSFQRFARTGTSTRQQPGSLPAQTAPGLSSYRATQPSAIRSSMTGHVSSEASMTG